MQNTQAQQSPSYADAIHDVLEPIAPGFWATNWEWVVIAAAAAVIVIVLLVVFLKRSRRLAPIDPSALARSRLARLEETAADHSDGDFAAALAGVLRDHLQARDFAPADRLTAEEMNAHLARGRLPEETTSALMEILGECDLARFAGVQLDPDKRQQLAQEAANCVDAIDAAVPNPELKKALSDG